MAMQRIMGLVLLVVWGGVALCRFASQLEMEEMECTWVQTRSLGSESIQRLVDDVRQMGAVVKLVGGIREVTFVGPAPAWTKIVNRLVATPLSWANWQTTVLPDGQVKGRIVL